MRPFTMGSFTTGLAIGLALTVSTALGQTPPSPKPFVVFDATLYSNKPDLSVYGIQPAKREHLKPLGEWNSQEVTMQGRKIKIVLNGGTIVDCDLDEVTKNGTMDGAEHPGLKRTAGHLGFLGHGDRVDLRNIRIKDLGAKK